MRYPKKALGQHWLKDEKTLQAIVASAGLSKDDTVLEIGPGTGLLTAHLLGKAGAVIAVEKDEQLANRLGIKIRDSRFYLHTADILEFDLTSLPAGYKVVANIPFYLTGRLLKTLSESPNPPSKMVLLVQKEVADRICANPGQMSVLAVSTQLYYRAQKGQVVLAKLFMPPPKVDSQVVILSERKNPLFPRTGLGNKEARQYMRVVKTGFSSKRKKLRNSLAAGLGLSKDQADKYLKQVKINGDLRAQSLSLADWHSLYMAFLSAKVL